jgi:hypothetical protein
MIDMALSPGDLVNADAGDPFKVPVPNLFRIRTALRTVFQWNPKIRPTTCQATTFAQVAKTTLRKMDKGLLPCAHGISSTFTPHRLHSTLLGA